MENLIEITGDKILFENIVMAFETWDIAFKYVRYNCQILLTRLCGNFIYKNKE